MLSTFIVSLQGEERKENLRPEERAGQLLQEVEKERESIPASPALSDISVFSALDHRYGWSAAAIGRERVGGFTRQPRPLRYQRLLCSRPQV